MTDNTDLPTASCSWLCLWMHTPQLFTVSILITSCLNSHQHHCFCVSWEFFLFSSSSFLFSFSTHLCFMGCRAGNIQTVSVLFQVFLFTRSIMTTAAILKRILVGWCVNTNEESLPVPLTYSVKHHIVITTTLFLSDKDAVLISCLWGPFFIKVGLLCFVLIFFHRIHNSPEMFTSFQKLCIFFLAQNTLWARQRQTWFCS